MVDVNNSAIHTRREVIWQNPRMVDADNSAIHTRHEVKRQNPRMVAMNNSAINTLHEVKWQNFRASAGPVETRFCHTASLCTGMAEFWLIANRNATLQM